MTEAETVLAAAALRAAHERPYLSAALWSVSRLPSPGLGTLAVDRRWRLYYDPEVCARWSVEELAGVLYHEILHLLRDHAGRAVVADDPVLWNIAADLEINDDVKAEGTTLPADAIYPATFGLVDRLTAEEYLALLERRVVRVTGAESAGPGSGRCGAAATGQGDGREDDAGGVAPAEARVVARQVAHAVREHAKTRGTVPRHLARWAEALVAPRIDWRTELAALVRGALADASGMVDYSYRRPSRRQGAAGAVVLPTLRRPEPRVAVVVDTSGSMADTDLATALTEVAGILRVAGPREGVPVLAVDAAVQECRRVFRPEAVRLAGGGGTDMGAGLAAVERLHPRPEVAVVMTDGHTPWPAIPPRGIRVIVVLIGDGPVAPAWARSVRVEQAAAAGG